MKNTHKRMLTLLMAAVMFFSFAMTACAFQIPDINLINPTEPPATNPPATNPPATNPPATNPPATEPPATNPPATEPPATEPPATEPPATEPPATEPRDIATGLLTDAEKAVLAALTLEQYNEAGSAAANQKIAIWAYEKAGIDISKYLDKSVFNMMKAIFTGDGNSESGRTPILEGQTGYNANYSKMLVDGYYGGVDVKTEDKLFTAADFQVGDLFCAVYYPDPSSDAKNYYAGLYLGDGKFLMSNNAGGWSATIDSELVFKSTLADELAIYYVLRPEQLALTEEPGTDSTDPTPSVPETSEPAPSVPETSEPAPSVPETSEPAPSVPETSDPAPSVPETSDPTPSVPETSDPTPSVPETSDPTPSVPETSDPTPSVPETSDPTPSVPETSEPEAGLTAAEKKVLASLTVEDWEEGGKKNNSAAAKWFYQQTGMSTSNYFNSKVFASADILFVKSDTELWTVDTAATDAYYPKMLVDGYYGGKAFGAENSKTFTASDFEIGDLFWAYTQDVVDGSTKRTYYVGLYQGDGKFLMVAGSSCSVDTTTVFAENIAETFHCYFVLRLDQYLRSAG